MDRTSFARGGPGRAPGTISAGETESVVWPQSQPPQQAVGIYAGSDEGVLRWSRSGEALSHSVGGDCRSRRDENQSRKDWHQWALTGASTNPLRGNPQ